jgi:tellurite resistance protein TehA-like permease
MQEGKCSDFICGFFLGFTFGMIFVLFAVLMCRMNRMFKNGLLLGFAARVFATVTSVSDGTG